MTTDSQAGAGISRVRSNVPLLGSQPAANGSTTGFRASIGLGGVGRRTLGISLLMITVLLWTTSSFLASFIFSDSTYSKPFFVVYLNTSVFAVSLIPMALQYIRIHGTRRARLALNKLLGELCQDVVDRISLLRGRGHRATRAGHADDDLTNKLLTEDDEVDDDDTDASGSVRRRHPSESGAGLLRGEEGLFEAAGSTAGISADRDAATAERLLGESDEVPGDGPVVDLEAGAETDDESAAGAAIPPHMLASFVSVASSHYLTHEKLSVRETTWLSLEFCMLWFSANYLAVACLEYTSVASATIFTSLSSMFTLLFCALSGVEGFTVRKLLGVVASVVGIVLVSSIDLSGNNDESRGKFPHKTPGEIAAGDAMALLSAVVYGAYVTVMKQRVGHEDRVSMPLFFGLVGLFNVVFLWPGFVILHYSGLETFELPPTSQIWIIIVANSLSSFVSDMAWAYAMLLTTPLVVTVGLSLTIPLSLVGEMIQYNKYSSGLYWVGASIVVLSFLFVNHESHEPDEELLEEEA